MSQFSVNGCLSEYMFASVIESHNIKVRNEGRYDRLISVEDGRAVHAVWLDDIKACSRQRTGVERTVNTAAQKDILQALKDVLVPYLDSDDLFVTNQDMARDRFSVMWDEMTGITATVSAREQREKEGQDLSTLRYIPLSPYDEQYAQRDLFQKYGSEMLWVEASGFVQAGTSLKSDRNGERRTVRTFVGNDKPPQDDADISVYRMHYGNENAPADYRPWMASDEERARYGTGFQPVPVAGKGMSDKLFKDGDLTGVALFRRYMTDEEYSAAAKWMAGPPGREVPPEERMTQQMGERGVAICEYLRNNGIPFHIEPDMFPGQLCAKLDNTKISIRIADTNKEVTDGKGGVKHSHDRYIGRIWNDGVEYTLNASGDYRPSVGDTLMLLQYALGDSVRPRLSEISGPGFDFTGLEVIGQQYAYKGMEQSRFRLKQNMDTDEQQFSFNACAGVQNSESGRSANHGMLYVQISNRRVKPSHYFATEDSAVEYLEEMIASAKENFRASIGLDGLIAQYDAHENDSDYSPVFSGTEETVELQRIYWNALQGTIALYRPEGIADRESDPITTALFHALGFPDSELPESYETSEHLAGGDIYADKDPRNNVRRHLNDSMEMMFGSFAPGADGKRFAPELVAHYAEGGDSVAARKSMISAMRKLGFDGSELLGSDVNTASIRDDLIRFDEESAKPMRDIIEELNKDEKTRNAASYVQAVRDKIMETMKTMGCIPEPDGTFNDDDIRMDKNGIIHYKAQLQFVNNSRECFPHPVEGEIGQIFIPDGDGLVQTLYNGSRNKLFTPGFEHVILPQDKSQPPQSADERSRFYGMQYRILEAIGKTVRQDLMAPDVDVWSEDERKAWDAGVPLQVGSPTGLNNVYKHIQRTDYTLQVVPEEGETLKDAYIRQCHMLGNTDEQINAVFRTNAGKAVYSKEMMDKASVETEYKFNKIKDDPSVPVSQLALGREWDIYLNADCRNVSIPALNDSCLIDPEVTGSGKNQGKTHYLVEGAHVDLDGKAFPAPEPSRCAIMLLSEMKYAANTASSRVQIVAQNCLENRGIDDCVGVAQMTCGGWTFDDGALVSKNFAEKHMIFGEDGKLRPLIAGDKICDFAGNKSVIAAVVDPDMDDAEAEKRGLGAAVCLFRDNEELDVIQSPYSPVSRYNAAGALWGMEDNCDLNMSDGSVVKGGIAAMPMMVTREQAEHHITYYLHDGRSMSAQAGWTLSGLCCEKVMDEVFGPNGDSLTDMREYLNVLGYDFSETGELRKGYVPHNGEERYVFRLPDAQDIRNCDAKGAAEAFGDKVGYRGGLMELPFKLDLSSGAKMIHGKDEASGRDTYLLPVMTPDLRGNHEFIEDVSIRNEYNQRYQTIYRSAVEWLKADEALKTETDSEKRKKLNEDKNRSVIRAQQNYNSMANEIFTKRFGQKHNVARDSMLARRMPDSATLIWTPDPTLDVNTLGLSKEAAGRLGLQDGDSVLMLRDPIIRTYGMRYMNVQVRPDISGASVNPLMDVSFDGDFDGDSIAVFTLKTPEARHEAYMRCSFEQNMLDMTRVRGDRDLEANPYLHKGDCALMLNDTMDLVSTEQEDLKRYNKEIEVLKESFPEGSVEYETALTAVKEPLMKERADIEHEFNLVYNMRNELTENDRMERNRDLTAKLSDYTRRMFGEDVATEVLSFSNPEAYMESLGVMAVDHGAKGDINKLKDCGAYGGWTFETEIVDGKEKIKPGSVCTAAEPLITGDDRASMQGAMAIKAMDTGLAGANTQKVVMMLRDCPLTGNAVMTDGSPDPQRTPLTIGLELTYNIQQGLMDAAKKDAAKARKYQDKLHTVMKDVWSGRAITTERDGDGNITGYSVRKDARGREIQATEHEWAEICKTLYGEDLGCPVNPELVDELAAVITDKNTGKVPNMLTLKTLSTRACGMDRLAYFPEDARQTLRKMAEEHEPVFSGRVSSHMIPDVMKENIRLASEGRQDEMIAIMPAASGPVAKLSGRADTPVPVRTEKLAEETVTRTDLPGHLEERRMPKLPEDDVTENDRQDGDGDYGG